MQPFTVHPGDTPLVVSVPHAGTAVPPALAARLTPAARPLPDTDWFVDRLYAFARDLGASLLVATASRMVVDLNRPADDTPLYPGRAGTGLVPEELFDGRPVWTGPVSEADRAARIADWWRPYHDQLRATLDAVRARHGHVVLWDAHSIRARVPRLFEGELPTYNLGTFGGRSCAPSLQASLEAVLADQPRPWVSNGRFQGGFITRGYGAPGDGVHAVQLELVQDAYMVEEPPAWHDGRAAAVRPTLARLLTVARDWRPDA